MQSNSPKVSIITPFYNAQLFIKDAIESVLKQSHSNWELILINDGSTDKSAAIVQGYVDERITYIEQDNKGVASARNAGFARMKGDFFCFLDADDVLPAESLAIRLAEFRSNPLLSFLDGHVAVMDGHLRKVLRKWRPRFTGNPLKDLAVVSGNSFFGGTWMIRREQNRKYEMREGLTHSEDLLFYMELSRKGGLYGFTDQVIMHYRDSPNSAMKCLKGLEAGYRLVYNVIKGWEELNGAYLHRYRARTKQIMFRSYLRRGHIKKALGVLNSWL